MPDTARPAGWVQKGFALLMIIFCMEIGVFLLFYPWTEQWTQSVFPSYLTALRGVWLNGYFRGAVSGFGVLDLWIALGEVFRLRRFSPPPSVE
jgi:hypothetical protein